MPGAAGDTGGNGVPGTPDVHFTAANVGPSTSAGSLWIKTEVDPGVPARFAMRPADSVAVEFGGAVDIS
jgi:hypothetical protein